MAWRSSSSALRSGSIFAGNGGGGNEDVGGGTVRKGPESLYAGVDPSSRGCSDILATGVAHLAR